MFLIILNAEIKHVNSSNSESCLIQSLTHQVLSVQLQHVKNRRASDESAPTFRWTKEMWS